MKSGSEFKAAAATLAILAAGAASASHLPQGVPLDASNPATVTFLLQREEDMEWLARNMFFEARNQSRTGRIAVGHVVMNRVESPRFPNSIREVIEAPRQFSWTHDGKSDDPMKHARRSAVDGRSWAKCRLYAFFVYHGMAGDPTGGSVNYHATSIKPPVWTKGLRRVGEIGDHVFYQSRRRG